MAPRRRSKPGRAGGKSRRLSPLVDRLEQRSQVGALLTFVPASAMAAASGGLIPGVDEPGCGTGPAVGGPTLPAIGHGQPAQDWQHEATVSAGRGDRQGALDPAPGLLPIGPLSTADATLEMGARGGRLAGEWLPEAFGSQSSNLGAGLDAQAGGAGTSGAGTVPVGPSAAGHREPSPVAPGAGWDGAFSTGTGPDRPAPPRASTGAGAGPWTMSPVGDAGSAAGEPPAAITTTADAAANGPAGGSSAPGQAPAAAALSGWTTLGFTDGLAGWRVFESGGSGQGRGDVTAGSALLREGDSFLVGLERDFVVPENPSPLVFRYTELNFDTTADGRIRDAFEASVLGADGLPLVAGHAGNRDAFYNATEGHDPALGAGGTVEGLDEAVQTVTLDLSGIAAGTLATVRFRLVNNDGDEETSVRLLEVLGPASGDEEPPTVAPIADVSTREGDLVHIETTFAGPGAGRVYTAEVAWGDGTVAPALVAGAGGSGTLTAAHTFADDGTYDAVLTLRDGAGGSASVPFRVVVANVAPTLHAGLSFAVEAQAGGPGVAVSIDGRFLDPGFTRPSAGTAETFSVQVDWGDMTQVVVADVTQGGPGQETAGAFRARRSFPAPGVYNAVVTLRDDDGGEAVQTLQFGVARLDVTRSMNMALGGSVPVLVMRDPGFDATRIDVQSVRFGPAAAGPANNVMQVRASDVRFNFRVQDSGFRQADDTALLTGRLADGTPFAAVDAVTVLNGIAAPAPSDPGATKFFVADAGGGTTFRYGADGAPLGSFGPDTPAQAPRGVTSNAAGDRVWILDGTTHSVVVQGPDGALLGSWRALDLQRPEGIALSGDDLWIVDAGSRTLRRYPAAAGLAGGAALAAQVLPLAAGNVSATGVETDGQVLWVTDDAAGALFVYNRSGDFLGRWQLDPDNAAPSGLTADPTGGTDLWVVDRDDLLVYHYAGATTRRDGQAAAPGRFPLAPGNAAPEGIADPPVLVVAAPVDGAEGSQGRTLVVHGTAVDGGLPVPVRVDGAPAEVVDAAGNFFHRVTIDPGPNTLEVAAGDPAGAVATTTVRFTGTDAALAGLDFNALDDLTGLLAAEYGRTSWYEARDHLHSELTLFNASGQPVTASLLVGVTNISDPSVALLGPDALSPQGIPLLDFGGLDASDRSGPRPLVFYNPDRVPFTYDLVIFGRLNRAPEFVTVPRVEGTAGRSYRYEAAAVDPDGDPLQYSLLAAPAGMTIDAQTGRIDWAPGAEAIGNHSVLVRVEDGRGGLAEQRYLVTVVAARPNRPPTFLSVPPVDARAGQPYTYPSVAVDPDDDPLGFSLVISPDGMSVDPATGEVLWTPTDAQVGTATVWLRVTDGRGGEAIQNYTIRVGADPANGPPVIVSEPTTTHDVPRFPNPASGQVDPDRINLDLAPGESITQTVAITLQSQGAEQGYADVVFVVDESGSMSGEHEWLEEMVLDLDAALLARGIGPNRYFLVGYGGGGAREPGHLFSALSNASLALFGPGDALVQRTAVGSLMTDTLFIAQVTAVGEHVLEVSKTGAPASYAFNYEILTPATTTAPLALGTLVSDAIVTPKDEDRYTFTLDTASRVVFDSLTNNSNLNWTLTGPAGTVVAARSFTQSDGSGYTANPVLDLVPGDYTLSVTAAGFSTGAYAFRLLDLTTAAPVVPGTAFTGTLDPANATAAYRFDAAAGDRVFFDVVAFSGTAARWRLVDPFGNLVFNQIFSDVAAITLPRAGTHTLLVEGDVAASGAPSYTLNVQPVPAPPPADLALGAIVEGAIDTPGRQDPYRFELAGRTLLALDSLGGTANLRYTLDGPTGTVFSNQTINSDVGNSFNPLALGPGDYVLTVSGNGDGTGTYRFRMLSRDAAPEIVPGTNIAGTLEPGSASLLYRLEAEAGDQFRFTTAGLTGPGISWRLYDPYGNALFQQSSFTNPPVQTLPRGGTYTLKIDGNFTSTTPSSFTFLVTHEGNVPPPVIDSAPLTLGAQVDDQIAVAGERDNYSFRLDHDSLLYFDSLTNNSNLRFTLVGPSGTVVNNVAYTNDAGGTFPNPIRALAGDYLLTIFGNGTSTGAYSFRLLDLSAAPVLTPGTPVSGTLAPANATAAYRFSAAAGQSFYFDTSGVSGTFSGWRLIDPYGNVLFNQGFSDVGTRTLPRDGVYTLLVEGAISGTGTPSYTLNVLPVVETIVPLTLGATVSETLAAPGELDRYSFTLAAETLVYFDSLTNNGNIRLSLDGPAGSVLTNQQFSNDTNLSPQRLVPGAYTLTVFGNTDAVGAYSFRLLDLSAAPEITPGTPFSDTLDPANSARAYRFDAEAGDRFYFDVVTASGTINRWRLLDPYGNALFNQTGLSDAGTRDLPRDGTYTLLVEGSINGTGTPGYTLNVSPVVETTTPLTLGATVTESLTAPGELDRYSFTLAAETLVYFDSLTNNSNIRLALDGPAGSVLTNQQFSNDTGLAPQRLAPGAYTLTVFGNTDAVGAYSFRLLDLSAAPVIIPGTPFADALEPANTARAYRFDAAAGDRFYFDVVSSSGTINRWRLLDPYGNVLFNQGVSDAGTRDLPRDGTYTLLVEGAISGTGTPSYTLNVSPVVETTTSLTLGATVTESLSGPGELDRYSFTLSAETLVYFDSLTNNSNIRFSLDGPAGSVLTNQQFSNDTGLAPQRFAPGSYTLTVFGNADAVGAYSFRLLDLTAAPVITPGTPLSDTLEPANSARAYRFDAAAGDRFYFDVVTASGTINRWRLLDPYGNALFNQTGLGDAGTRDLPRDGTYTLLVEGSINGTGTPGYTLNVSPVVETTTPLTLGATVTESLTAPGELDRYSFTLPAEVLVYFDSLTNNGNIRFSLDGPAGSVLTNQQFSNDTGLAPQRLAPGAYTLTVSGNADAVGAYSFRLLDLSAAPAIIPGTPVSDTLDPANSARAYRFDAAAGQRFYFDMVTSSGSFARWRLLDPFGNAVFNQGFSDAGSLALPRGGPYTLLVEGAINGTGTPSYTLNVQPVLDTTTPLTLGVTVSESLSGPGELDRYSFTLPAEVLVYFDSLTNNSNIRFSLDGPAGPVLANQQFTNDTNLAPQRLAAGSYVLTVSGNADAVGPYSLRLLDLAAGTVIAPGEAVNATIDPLRETDVYRIDVAAGDQFTFTPSLQAGTAPVWRLFDPYGNLVFSRSFTSPGTQNLTRGGIYSLLVEGQIGASSTSTYSFTAAHVGNVPPPVVSTTPLAPGTAVEGALSTAGEQVRYSFSVSAETSVYFDSLTNNGNIRFSLDGPAGAVLTNQQFSNDTNIVTARLVPGSYQLTVFGSGSTTGPYSFRLLDLSAAVPIIPGTPVSDALEPANSARAYRFDAAAGQRFYFDMVTSSGSFARWRLLDPFGNAVFNQGFSDAGTRDLPRDGTYTLLVEGSINGTGTPSYTLNVQPVVETTTPLTLGATVSESLTAPGELDRYGFTLSAETLVYFDSLTNNGNIRFSLDGPAGSVLANQQFNNDNTLAPQRLAPGSYVLTVSGNADAVGAYSFRLLDLSAAPVIIPGTPFADALEPANSARAYRFDAAAGDRFYFDVVTSSGTINRWRLLDPYGNAVFNQGVSDAGTRDLPRDGTYTLLVEGTINGTGTPSYTLNASPVVEATTPLTLGATVTESLTAPGELDRYSFTLPAETLVYFDSLTNNSNIRLALDGPAGPVLTNQQFSNDTGLAPQRLAPGAYTLTVSGNADAVGAYSFRLLDLTAAPVIIPGTPFADALEPANSARAYRFDAAAGDRFYFDVVTSSGTINRWRLLDPYGNILFNQGVSDAGTRDLPRDGTYTLLVEGSINGTGTPSYTLNVSPVEVAQDGLVLGETIDGVVAGPGDRFEFTFVGVAGQRLYFDGLGATGTLAARLIGPSGAALFNNVAPGANFGPFTLRDAGTYQLVVEGTGDRTGTFSARLIDLDDMPRLTPGSRPTGLLDPALLSDLYRIDAQPGQVVVLRPGPELISGSAAQIAEMTNQLEISGGFEDGYHGIHVGLGHGSFRPGAAVNVVLITDEDRDILDPSLTFESTLADLAGHRALLNGVLNATFRAGTNNNVLGVDSEGTAYLADGQGGYTTQPGGVYVSGDTTMKRDYVDMAWALGGAAWDLNRLRVGGLAATSFTRAFVDIKVREIEQQLQLEVIASDPAVDFENLTGILTGLSGGDTATFDVSIAGDGRARSFDLLFVRPGTNIVLGSIPVTIGTDYLYPVEAIDPDGDPLTYQLVDGPAGAAIDPVTGRLTWEPGAAGVYRFTVAVGDGRGGRDVQQFDLTVTAGAPNLPPAFTSTPPTLARVEQPFAANVVAEDPDGDRLAYYLVSAPEGVALDRHSGRLNWTPARSQLGPQRIEVRVLDGRGGEARQVIDLVVVEDTENQAPAIDSDPSGSVVLGQTFRHDLAASDPDGDPLLFRLLTGPAGLAIDPTTGVIVWTPNADQLGESFGVVRVEDGRGGSDFRWFALEVRPANTPPTITSTPTPTARVGLAYTYQVRAQDADDDPVRYRLDAAPAGMTIDPETGLIRWTPSAAQLGLLAPVIVLADDGRGGLDTQQFEVQVAAPDPNDPPLILSTPRTTIGRGATFHYQVAAFDPDGDPLQYSLTAAPAGMTINPATGAIAWETAGAALAGHAVEVRVEDGRGGADTQQFTLSVVARTTNAPPSIVSNPPAWATLDQLYRYDVAAEDPDGDPVIWALDSAPAGMSIDPRTGQIRWRPAEHQIGQAEVIVRATDALGGAGTQRFTVTVRGINAPPTITSTPPTEAAAGNLLLYAVRAIDPEGDPLVFRLVSAPAGMSIDPATGLVRWTPSAAQAGPQNVTLDVDDGQGGTAAQSFTVVVAPERTNRPPAITSAPPFTATVGEPYAYAIAANDPDGDPLRYELLSGPAGVQVDTASGLLSWSPATDQLGLREISIGVFDPSGAGVLQRYTVRVLAANRPPTIQSSPTTAVTAGQTYRYVVLASDPDLEPLTFALTEAPDGMAIEPNGRITWATSPADIGPATVRVRVSDPRGGVATQSFTLTVAADTQAPRVVLQASPNPANIGQAVTLLVQASDDVAATELTLSVGGHPLTLDATGRATFTPTAIGTLLVEATARDAAGNTGGQTLSLLVRDPSDVEAPVVRLPALPPGTTITAPTPIVGTVSDPNLVSYVLTATPVSGGAPREIFRGTTPVVDGVLGIFDPSLLANDTYTVTLTATDLGGHTASIQSELDVAGDLKLGNFTLSFTDLMIPVSGIPIVVGRTYDTLNSGTRGDFGYGWRLELADTDLRTNVPRTHWEEYGLYSPFRDGTRVYVTTPGGRREGFTFEPRLAPGLKGGFLGILEPRFVPDAGVTSTLSVANADLRRFDDGTYSHWAGSLPYNPADTAFGGYFTLTTKEGISYRIDGDTGDLITVSDRNGNALEFRNDGIFSKSGQNVTFERDGQGRISAVIDPLGNRIRYGYDAAGDLVSVTDREGDTTRFTYRTDRPHYLESVIDPLGRTGIRGEYDASGRLSRIIDAAGQAVRLTYDPANSLHTVEDALGNPTTYEYDTRGNVVTEVDALGGITRRTYDANNNLLSETDPLGRTTSYTYDARGNALTIRDPLGHVTRNTYNSFNNVLSATDPLGRTIRSVYDSRGNILSITDPAGLQTRLTYDAAGNPTSIVDPVGTLARYEYDARGHVSRLIDPLGNATTYTYDAAGRLLTESWTQTTPTGPRTFTTTTTYDAEGRVTSVRDAEGNLSRAEYDAAGNQVATIDALGRRTTYTYDPNGLLIETIHPDGTSARTEYDAAGRESARVDALGRRTELRYDRLGRLVETIHPDTTPATLDDNPRTRVVYDAAGQVIAQLDERGNRTEYDYDAAGRRTVVRDALGHAHTTTYDAAGRVTSSSDPLGRATRYDYDASGRRVGTIYADGTTMTTSYDARGRAVARTDQAGRTSRLIYDAADRLSAAIDPLDQRTEYAYDERGNLTAQVDALGRTTRHEYDGLGRRTATVLPLGQRWTTAYDAAGNITRTTDANGDTITYEYDTRDRLTARNVPGGESTRFTYTPTGQRATAIDGRGTTTYAYDARDRLLSRTEPDGRAVAYTYDLAGNRISVTSPSGTTAYSFDALNRPETVTDPDQGVTRYTYDVLGNLLRTELPNGTAEAREYDTLGRLISVQHTGPSGALAGYRYTLSPTGRRDAVAEHGGRRVEYHYDALDRVIEELITEADASTRRLTYAYDPVGNRLSRDDTAEGRTTYEYDANDRLLTETLGGRITRYTYDENGNTTSQAADAVDRALYEWDPENRLVSARVTDATGTSVATYQYDADGLRVGSTADGDETRYLLDVLHPYPQVLEEYTPGGILRVSYVHGLDLVSQDRPGTTGRSFFHADGLGSTRLLTDEAGLVTDRYIYDAFGRTIGQFGSTGNVYLFAGEARDPLLGWDYLRARYMDPSLGRFVSRDPFDGLLETPITLHKYLYANANPISLIDPGGLMSMGEIGAVFNTMATLARYASPILKVYNTVQSVVDIINAIHIAIQVVQGGGLTGIPNYGPGSFKDAVGASTDALRHFDPNEAVESILRNYRHVLARAFPTWSKWLATNGLKVEGLVIYLPSPPSGAIYAAIPAGKVHGYKLTLIAGGASHTSRVFGLGLDQRGKGAKQYAQVWRMDYHSMHFVGGTKRFELGKGSLAVIRDDPFHHHVVKPNA